MPDIGQAFSSLVLREKRPGSTKGDQLRPASPNGTTQGTYLLDERNFKRWQDVACVGLSYRQRTLTLSPHLSRSRLVCASRTIDFEVQAALTQRLLVIGPGKGAVESGA